MGDTLLSGLRVAEVAHPLTEYAGLVLAGLGAEVFLIEPPRGAQTRSRLPRVPNAGTSTRGSIAFLSRNTNKLSVVIDPDVPSDRELAAKLCERVDVVLDAEPAELHGLVSTLAVQTRITITDERGLGTSSIVGFAASGGLASSGWPDRPPCNAPGWLALDGASVYAAIMALIGVFARRRGATAVAYEIPYEEAAIAAVTPWTRTLHAYGMEANGQGIETRRLGAAGFPIYEARDGYVRAIVATPKQWQAFVILMGSPDELVSHPWTDPLFRADNVDALHLMCEGFTRLRTVEELFHDGQKLGLTITPVYSLNGFRRDAHVCGRNMFVPLSDPEFGDMELVRTPLVAGDGVAGVPCVPAPALDEHRARAVDVSGEARPERKRAGDVDCSRPLTGLKVLELGVGAVVPEAASLLALFGAEVIKIESLVRVDFLRQRGLDGLMDVNNSPTFNQLNLGTESFAVDMTKPPGVELVRRLAEGCDVVMENMRGGVVQRWGLDFASASVLRKDVVYLSSQGLGRGVYDGYQTYGPNLQTFSGVTAQWAHPDDRIPVGGTLNHPDHIAGKQALVAVLAAVLRRDLTGKGAFLEAAQVEAAAYLIRHCYLEQHHSDGELVARGNRSPDMVPHGCYPCAGDDRWVAISVDDDERWSRLYEVVGTGPDSAWWRSRRFQTISGRLACVGEIDAALAAWTCVRSPEEVEAALRAAGVAVSRVVTGDDMAADAQFHRSGFFATLAHPTSGTRTYTGVPVRLSEGRRLPARRPPLLGEHTERVLYELLGLEPREVDVLMAKGVVGH